MLTFNAMHIRDDRRVIVLYDWTGGRCEVGEVRSQAMFDADDLVGFHLKWEEDVLVLVTRTFGQVTLSAKNARDPAGMTLSDWRDEIEDLLERKCPECERVFDLTDEDDAEEWALRPRL